MVMSTVLPTNNKSPKKHEHRSELRRRRSMLSSSSVNSKKNNMQNDDGRIEISETQILTSLSPLKKQTKTDSVMMLPSMLGNDADDELNTWNENDTEDDDEFFLAITTDKLETGSCPDFYWYSDLGELNAIV